MAHFAKTKNTCWPGLVFLGVLAGCASPDNRAKPTSLAPTTAAGSGLPTVSAVSYQVPPKPDVFAPPPMPVGPAPLEVTPTPAAEPVPTPARSAYAPAEPSAITSWSGYRGDPCDPCDNQAELSVDRLVAEVQARNPSIEAASAAWRAAAQRYPQAVSLDDPMFSYLVTPTNGLGADNGGGWMVQASQKVPWWGKRELRGSAASAEADAMKGDMGDVRLRLSEAARTAFYDYYLARRQTEVNDSTYRLVAQFREIAWNKYQVNQAAEQDVLQADVELATIESRRTELARDEQVAVARVNTLLHRAAEHPLPPPPAAIRLGNSLPGAEALQQIAEQSRPDLAALQARIRAEEANVELACKEYYPDVNLVGMYDARMPENMRAAVGMDINVPLPNGRRSAAEREASERLAQRRAEYQERLDQVRYEVQSSLAQAQQSERVVHLYEERILPAAVRSVESAQAGYINGKLDFLRLLDAERQVNTQREMYHQAMADYHRRLAELERAVGGWLAMP